MFQGSKSSIRLIGMVGNARQHIWCKKLDSSKISSM